MAKIGNRVMVEELKAGKPAGCRRLMDLYQNRLLNEATHVFRVGREDAEEIVSDVLLTVIRKIDSFQFKRSDGDFHYWVMTIFRNRVRDLFRENASRGLLVRQLELERLGGDGEESHGQPERALEIVDQYQQALLDDREDDGEGRTDAAREKLRVIAEVLDGMEAWERVLLRCRALDVPFEEIARYTDKPVSQLKVYHGRVKKKFIALLSKHFPELVPS